MDFFYLLDILLFGVTVVQGSAKYFIVGDNSHGCSLATPPIQFSTNGIYTNLSKNDIDDVSFVAKENASFRIGYVQHYVVFRYKGCASTGEIDSTMHAVVQNNVGRCSTVCGTDIVGFQENTCHCISNLNRITSHFQRGCNTNCSIETKTPCGGRDTVSLYMKARNLPFLMQNSLYNNIGSCLASAHTKTETNYIWADCKSSFITYCLKDNRIQPTGVYKPWAQAMQICVANSSLPVNDVNLTQSLPADGVQKWTGYIRSYSINNLTDGMEKNVLYLQGYVKLTSGNAQLYFDRRNITMNTLCNLGTRAANHSLTPKVAEQRSTTLTISPYTSASEADSRDNRQDIDFEAVILYTVIPVSLVIILGTVGIILWRRGSLPFCRQTNGDNDEKMSTTTANTKLESEPNSEAQQHGYFVLEPQCNFDSLKYIKEHDRTEDDCGRASSLTYNHAFSVTNNSTEDFKEDDYDTTTSVSKPLGYACAMSSVYDRLENTDTYNHIGDVTGINAKTDDTYNHLEPKKSEMYDTTSTVSRPVIVVDYDDDMYSKVLKNK